MDLETPSDAAAVQVTSGPDTAVDLADVAVADLEAADLAAAAAVRKTAPGPDTSGPPGTAADNGGSSRDRSTAGGSS